MGLFQVKSPKLALPIIKGPTTTSFKRRSHFLS
ncbi:uncharacterized protein G2W53_043143 [Senna tora]|uniref:Uncharacterized protein n=1 Tax=Senna tora TaxID=362788 RepID=A0A834SNI6_9FABA|nr:uncharacterized protein G2W53_043143 [Senna tora]